MNPGIRSNMTPSASTSQEELSPPLARRPPGILVVDDDPALLALLKIALPRKGFVVWPANGGQAALDLYRRQQAEVAVVLLDVRMPGLDGPQTLSELQRINPNVVCCFMSGHTGSYSVEHLLGMGARHCFHKPFQVEDVCRTLWECAQEAV